jgi:hypothetical protein
MAAHYANGGLPPWVAAGTSGKAPLPPNDYNANTGVTYPPDSYPKAGYQNSPSQFGVYGNLPPAVNTHTTGVTDYSAATYHTATPVPQSPPPTTFSPIAHTIERSSVYSSSTPAPNPMSPPSNPQFAPPTQYSAPSSPAPVSPVPYGVPPPIVYSATPPPPAVAGGSHDPIPTYSGVYGAGQYPTEKGWEYTNPPAGTPMKQ